MNPLAGLFLVVLCGIVLTGSSRSALLALLAGALYLSQTQAVDLLNFNLFPTRVLELALLARIIGRGEWRGLKINGIDRAFVMLYVYTTVVFLLRTNEGQVFEVGVLVDAFLVYFSCRVLIDSPEAFRWLLKSFVLLLIPFVLIVGIERLTSRSPLAFMGWGGGYGGWMRDGGVRCFGSFRHPSLLGTLGVSFIPIFVGMAFSPVDRVRAVAGIGLCLFLVWCANSGGPISGVAFGCVAWMCWVLRRRMRQVRWGIAAFITLAAIMMKAPVWYLIAHVGAITGGDGWHRAFLMDVSFRNLGKWWLAGMPFEDTAGWFPYVLVTTGAADITNEFVSFGLSAGLGSMALFIFVLTRGFSALGNALQAVRTGSTGTTESEYLLWGLGAMLAAHIVNWLGITYFDQTYVFWFAQLAAISTLSDWYIKEASQGMGDKAVEESGLEVREETITAQ